MSDLYLRRHVGDDEPSFCYVQTHWVKDSTLQDIADAFREVKELSESGSLLGEFNAQDKLEALLDALEGTDDE